MAISEAQKRATSKYQSKTYGKVCLRIRNDGEVTRDTIQQAASEAGESLNEYILNAVKMRMKNENAGSGYGSKIY